MQVLARSTLRTLLKQAKIVDSDVAVRSMLAASPIHIYDHNSHEWKPFDSAKDWHDSRKAVDSLIRRLNDGKEWFVPSTTPRVKASDKKEKWYSSGELSSFVRQMYRGSPFSRQNLNFAFSAVKALNHTLSASKSLLPPEDSLIPDCSTAPWFRENFKVLSLSQDVTSSASSNAGAHMLVAHPLLPGFFRHSVVLVIRHDTEGAVGVVLNRPLVNSEGMEVPVWSAIPEEHPLLSKYLAQNTIMVGGPVSTANSIHQSMLIFHRFPSIRDAVRVSKNDKCDLCVGGNMDEMIKMFEEGKCTPDDFMCVLGYSGWGGEQLEGEIASGSWISVQYDEVRATETSATTALVMRRTVSGEPTATWMKVLHCLGGDFQHLGKLRSFSKYLFDDDE